MDRRLLKAWRPATLRLVQRVRRKAVSARRKNSLE